MSEENGPIVNNEENGKEFIEEIAQPNVLENYVVTFCQNAKLF